MLLIGRLLAQSFPVKILLVSSNFIYICTYTFYSSSVRKWARPKDNALPRMT